MATSEDSTATEEPTETELSPERVAEMLASGEAQLVDVRQQFEWDAGRIPGAIHIPLDSLPSRAGEVDRERPVIFGCRSGARSAMATEAFRASGFEAFNLAGGIEAWVENGQKIEPDGGDVALPRPDNS
jgi:rhodanese-related sulfurtransferase